MSNNEKKYGKVITIRLKPENSWIVDLIDKDIQKTQDGKKIVSGRSEFVELILINYYADRRKVPQAQKSRKRKEAATK
jgi:hypothetical protein